MAITIRRATLADVPQFEFVFEWHDGERATRAALLQWFEKAKCVLVAEDEQFGIIGQIMYANMASGDGADAGVYVYFLSVRPAKRWCGAGTMLLNRAEEMAREEGARFLALTVDRLNTGALAWYKRRGYVEYGEQQSEVELETRSGAPITVTCDEVCLYLSTSDDVREKAAG